MKPNTRIFSLIVLSVLLIVFGSVLPVLAQPHSPAANSPTAPNAYYPDPNPKLIQLNVRRAIAYCTNRWALADAAYPALSDAEIDALMMDSFFPSDHWAYTQPSMTYPYNPALGQSLLDQADWTLPVGANYRLNAAGEELALVLTTTGSDIRVAWAEVLEGQLLDCGIRLVRLHASPGWVFGYELSGYGDINGALTRRDFELAGFAWIPDADPQLAGYYACDQVPSEFNNWQGQNYMGWCNPTASAEAYLGDNTALTQAERKAHYAIVQEQFAQDMPSLPLFLRYDDPTDGTWEHLDFNFTSPLPPPSALKQINVRRAIAYCTNRWALADAAYPALSDVEIDALMIDSFFPSDHWAYTQPSMTYPYNPALGQSLLDQAGWTLPVDANYRLNAAGEELALVLTTTDAGFRYDWADVLEGQLLDCGIRLVRLHASPGWVFGYELSGYGDINGALTRRDFELAGFTWVAEPDPQLAPLYACDQVPSELNGWQGQNLMGWCNPTASAEAYLGDNTALTQAERKAHYAIVQEQFAQDIPSLPLFLRYPVDGAWEHLDFNLYTLEKSFLPMLIR